LTSTTAASCTAAPLPDFRNTIAELALVPQTDPELTRLWQLCSAAGRENDRRRNGDQGSTDYFLKLKIYLLTAITTTDSFVKRVEAKRAERQKLSPDERRWLRELTKILPLITDGIEDLRTRFPEPVIISADLPRLLRQHFVDLSDDDINSDAKLIAELFDLPA
jgi:hypothetical protein